MKAILTALILMGAVGPVFALPAASTLKAAAVPIPGGEKGVGLDDVNFSMSLDKVLVPAGKTGKLYLVDPESFTMTPIDGFTKISSADAGDGFIFTADRGTNRLDAVDINTGKIAAQAPLAADADIVRYVRGNHEVWVTEPDGKKKKQVEIFSFKAGGKPVLAHAAFIVVPDGPESLTIDNTHQRAYTNLGKQAAVIDLHTYKVIGQWPNTCKKSRGTAVDEAGNFLFVACGEGKAVVFDLSLNGKQVSSMDTGPGADLVYYNPMLSHFYISGGKNATVSVLGVSSKGELSLLGIGQAAQRAHCVTGDGQNNIWVCDPRHGQLLRYKDTFPAVQ